MKRNMELYLQDMLESILSIEEYTKDISEDKFCSDRLIQDAVVRRLEIIGEAAKNVDADFRNRHPQIPWKKIAGMRDIIAHEYFGVRLDRIWDVVKGDLPQLKEMIRSMIKEENT